MADIAQYNKVADVIGEEMDKAWNNILARLSSNELNAFSDGGQNITSDDLQGFFSNLGGCQMGIQFSSIAPKGETIRFNATQLTPTNFVGGDVSVSVGVNIKF